MHNDSQSIFEAYVTSKKTIKENSEGWVKPSAEEAEECQCDCCKSKRTRGVEEAEEDCECMNRPVPSMTEREEEGVHDETDMSNPEEKREVQIAKEILAIAGKVNSGGKLEELANELIKMHGQE